MPAIFVVDQLCPEAKQSSQENPRNRQQMIEIVTLLLNC